MEVQFIDWLAGMSLQDIDRSFQFGEDPYDGIPPEPEEVMLFNENPVGTEVTYWPVRHRNGKRTKTRSKAFVSNSGSPVVFVEGVAGYVSIEHIDIGSLKVDHSGMSKDFPHLWG